VAQGFAQTRRGVTTYLSAQYNSTLYDYTKGNNPWGMGLGLQAFYSNKSRFKPSIELTYDLYLEDDKVFRSNPDGSFPNDDNTVRGMLNLLIGSSFHPVQNTYLSFLAGPAFIGDQTLLAIKPSLGFYFSETEKVTLKISYINVFNRTKITNDDFGSLGFSLGIKLF
jgi:hypothetical protein